MDLKIEKYSDEIDFFRKYASGGFFKFFHRMSVLPLFPRPKHLAALLLPAKASRAFMTPDEIMRTKYIADLEIYRKNMRSFFKGRGIFFANYSFSALFPALTENRPFSRSESITLGNLFEMIDEIFIRDAYEVRKMIGTEDKVIIDCGANIGLFSLFAHTLNPESEIYAFEPASRTFSMLNKLLEENGIRTKIIAVNSALGENEGEITMNIVSEGAGLSNAISDSEFHRFRKIEYAGKEKVSLTTIDIFTAKHRLKSVDVIKLDTEGYEKRILKGARETIKKFKPKIICSAYHLPKDRNDIVTIIRSINPEYRHTFSRGGENLLFTIKRNEDSNRH